MLVQVGLGIANVLTQATVWSAIAHLAVASVLWAALVLAAAIGLVRPVAAASPPPDVERRARVRRVRLGEEALG